MEDIDIQAILKAPPLDQDYFILGHSNLFTEELIWNKLQAELTEKKDIQDNELNICNFVLRWMRLYPITVTTATNFVSSVTNTDMANRIKLQMLQNSVKPVNIMDNLVECNLLNRVSVIDDIDPITFAKQLCLLDRDITLMIDYEEFSKLKWFGEFSSGGSGGGSARRSKLLARRSVDSCRFRSRSGNCTPVRSSIQRSTSKLSINDPDKFCHLTSSETDLRDSPRLLHPLAGFVANKKQSPRQILTAEGVVEGGIPQALKFAKKITNIILVELFDLPTDKIANGIEYYIKVAKTALEIYDFNLASIIVTSLNNINIKRLENVWTSELIQSLNKLSMCVNVRDYPIDKPFIPIISGIMSDLLLITNNLIDTKITRIKKVGKLLYPLTRIKDLYSDSISEYYTQSLPYCTTMISDITVVYRSYCHHPPILKTVADDQYVFPSHFMNTTYYLKVLNIYKTKTFINFTPEDKADRLFIMQYLIPLRWNPFDLAIVLEKKDKRVLAEKVVANQLYGTDILQHSLKIDLLATIIEDTEDRTYLKTLLEYYKIGFPDNIYSTAYVWAIHDYCAWLRFFGHDIASKNILTNDYTIEHLKTLSHNHLQMLGIKQLTTREKFIRLLA